MNEAFPAFAAHIWDHWIWLTGLLLMVEPLIDYHFSAYRAWADQYASRKLRSRVAWSLSIGVAFVACFLSFQDQFQEARTAGAAKGIAEGERDEARRELSRVSPSGQQKTIEQLSADLRSARGQIDTLNKREQDRVIEQSDRSMHRTEFERIVAAFTPFATEFPNLQVQAVSASPNAAGYAVIFMSAFHAAGLTVNGVKPDDNASMLYPSQATVTSVQMKGLFIGVKNAKTPPDDAVRFQSILNDAGFESKFANWQGVSENAYVFVVSYK